MSQSVSEWISVNSNLERRILKTECGLNALVYIITLSIVLHYKHAKMYKSTKTLWYTHALL